MSNARDSRPISKNGHAKHQIGLGGRGDASIDNRGGCPAPAGRSPKTYGPASFNSAGHKRQGDIRFADYPDASGSGKESTGHDEKGQHPAGSRKTHLERL